jgi:carboxyl-terminal processing protease
MHWKTLLATTVLGLSLLLAPVQSVLAAPSDNNTKTLLEVYSMLVDDNYTHPDEEKVLQGAIEGMLKVVGDPYTSYFSPEEYKDFVNAINQSYAGIGIGLGMTDDKKVQITHVYPNSPAANAGLQEGDILMQVGDLKPDPDHFEKFAAAIRGAAGTDVTLKVQRGTAEPASYTLTRQEIELPTVSSQLSDDGIGYIGLYSFGEHTVQDFQKALSSLEEKGAKGIILDVRGNGGGYVQAALQIADAFLDKGTMISIHDKGEKIALDADAAASKLPLVVLVDKNSASASEILAGALQKNNRAKLIGEQSFGKGTMQSPVELPNGGYIKVSVDKWEFADGTSNHLVGLTPDIKMSRPETVMNAAVQQLLPDRQQALSLYRDSATGNLNDIDLKGVPSLQQVGDKLYLPLRYTVESLGAEVKWNSEAGAISFTLDGHLVSIDMRSLTLNLDGKPSALEAPVRTYNGSTYLSTDALQSITGQEVVIEPQRVVVSSK